MLVRALLVCVCAVVATAAGGIQKVMRHMERCQQCSERVALAVNECVCACMRLHTNKALITSHLPLATTSSRTHTHTPEARQSHPFLSIRNRLLIEWRLHSASTGKGHSTEGSSESRPGALYTNGQITWHQRRRVIRKY